MLNRSVLIPITTTVTGTSIAHICVQSYAARCKEYRISSENQLHASVVFSHILNAEVQRTFNKCLDKFCTSHVSKVS